MAGSIWGEVFRVSTWGESHGGGVGVVVDGAPAGISLSEEDIQKCLDRRKPGETKYSTPRKEGDKVKIMSGVFEGKTTGTPISMVVVNTSQKSGDYSNIANVFRPGHADFTFDAKYGFRDYRGGGRSSGRETIGRVAAGAIAMKILSELGVTVTAYTKQSATCPSMRFAACFLRKQSIANPRAIFPTYADNTDGLLGGIYSHAASHVSFKHSSTSS